VLTAKEIELAANGQSVNGGQKSLGGLGPTDVPPSPLPTPTDG
jgi:hypothetical protein